MKKILFVQSNLQPPGGANAVAVWMIEALKQEHRISVLTFEPCDLHAINEFYGTSLKPSEVEILGVGPLIHALIRLDPDPRTIQKICYLMRLCKLHGRKYDVMMMADNEVDFGVRGIQYLHYPYLNDSETMWRGGRQLARYGTWGCLLRGACRPWMLLSGFSFQRMKSNLSLTNSHWTQAIIKKHSGVEARVVYPPVPGEFAEVSWEKKKSGFVCVGRFDPCKRFEHIIEIVAQVREAHPEIELHIIGSDSNSNPQEWSEYREKLESLARVHPWVSIHKNIARSELVDLLCQYRYGIHAHLTEHFGIGVAEMVRAGCVVWVPNDGGQVEIVDDPRLIYADDAEAVEKIRRVLESSTEQAALHAHLSQQKQKFTTEKFMEQIREVVKTF